MTTVAFILLAFMAGAVFGVLLAAHATFTGGLLNDGRI